MNWETIQQLIRIVMFTVGSFFLGDAVANGEQFQGLIGGVVAAASFAWWFFWERTRPTPTV